MPRWLLVLSVTPRATLALLGAKGSFKKIHSRVRNKPPLKRNSLATEMVFDRRRAPASFTRSLNPPENVAWSVRVSMATARVNHRRWRALPDLVPTPTCLRT